MRSDIDRLMAERELGAIIAAGGEQQNTIRAYLSNGVDIHGGITIKKHGSAPTMLVSAMEIEEAAHSGLRVVTYDDLGWDKIYLAAEGDMVKARVNLWGRIFEYFELPAGQSWAIRHRRHQRVGGVDTLAGGSLSTIPADGRTEHHPV